MPHEEIMRLMHAMDEIREKIGLAYPCETEDGKTEEKNWKNRDKKPGSIMLPGFLF